MDLKVDHIEVESRMRVAEAGEEGGEKGWRKIDQQALNRG